MTQTLWRQNTVPRAEAREAAGARAEVDTAAAAATAALTAELEVARRGRSDAEEREAALQTEVGRKINRPKRTWSFQLTFSWGHPRLPDPNTAPLRVKAVLPQAPHALCLDVPQQRHCMRNTARSTASTVLLLLRVDAAAATVVAKSACACQHGACAPVQPACEQA